MLFRSVVAPSASACAAGGRPRHDVDGTDAQATDHELRQLTSDTPPIAELQAVQHLARNTIEGKRSEHAVGRDLCGSAGKRKAAAATEHRTGLAAPSASGGEGGDKRAIEGGAGKGHAAICTSRV